MLLVSFSAFWFTTFVTLTTARCVFIADVTMSKEHHDVGIMLSSVFAFLHVCLLTQPCMRSLIEHDRSQSEMDGLLANPVLDITGYCNFKACQERVFARFRQGLLALMLDHGLIDRTRLRACDACFRFTSLSK